jgi:hypothetical protein
VADLSNGHTAGCFDILPGNTIIVIWGGFKISILKPLLTPGENCVFYEGLACGEAQFSPKTCFKTPMGFETGSSLFKELSPHD